MIIRSLVIVSRSLAPYRVRFYREVAHALKLRGWRVTLLAANTGAKDHPWSDATGGTDDLRIVGVGDGGARSGFWRLVGKVKPLSADLALPSGDLLRFLEMENPQVVWTHEYSPFCLAAAAWARWRSRTSILSTDLGDMPPAYACSATQLIYHKAVADLYQKVIAQTREATRRSYPVGAPVFFAPHAISVDEYRPSELPPGDCFRFLFTGALDQRKGVDRLVEAARRMALRGLSFELRILGSGPLAPWLRSHPGDWLSFGGFVEGEALRQEYRRADAYVLPTREDTYAVTVHEAAASGLPLIIGWNAGARETLVEEEVSGFSVDADDIEGIEERMSSLLTNPGQAKRMGGAARQLAVKYDVALVGQLTADFIESGVSKGGLS